MENNYQLSRIHNYVHGLMSRTEMNALEREALEDPFLQDAIEGYRLQNGVDAKQLSLLQQRLATRVAEQSNSRNKQFYSWQRLAIGMAAGVLFVSVCILLVMRYLPQQRVATLTEVVVNESRYDFKIAPNNNSSDAIPVDGWEELYNQLSSNYSNSEEFQGTLYITFEIDNNQRAFNISVEGKHGVKYDELKDIIRNKMKWKGTQGDISLDIWEVGSYDGT